MLNLPESVKSLFVWTEQFWIARLPSMWRRNRAYEDNWSSSDVNLLCFLVLYRSHMLFDLKVLHKWCNPETTRLPAESKRSYTIMNVFDLISIRHDCAAILGYTCWDCTSGSLDPNNLVSVASDHIIDTDTSRSATILNPRMTVHIIMPTVPRILRGKN